MTNALTSTSDLTLELVRRVAWEGESAELSSSAATAVDIRREEFLQFVAANQARHLYGITTRHHTGAKTLLADADREEYGTRLPSTPASIGPALPQRLLRAVLVARTTDVLNGTAPLRAETAQRVLRMLDTQLPDVPARGAGEPGDIIPLGHLFRALFNGTLELGEGMALINGSPVATAVLCDAAIAGMDRVKRIESVLALAAVAIGAPIAHFSELVEGRWRDPFAAATMQNIRRLVSDVDPGTRLPYQAPVSFRSGPRMASWVRRTQAQAEECAELALRSSSNNPMFFAPHQAPPSGEIQANGGYHNPWAAPCLDALARAWADMCLLIAAQVNRLVEDPAGIGTAEAESHLSGFYMTASGWAEEARSSATATLLGVAGGGQTDTGTPDLLAWRKAVDVGQALDTNLAVLAAVSAHTMHAKGWEAPPQLTELLRSVLDVFPIGTAPLDFGARLQQTLAVIR